MCTLTCLISTSFLKEVDVGPKKAIVVYVPVSQVRGYQKIQVEKKRLKLVCC